MWAEKYRPKRLQQVIGQTKVVEKLEQYLHQGPKTLPNLLFYGPAGVSKTTCALALIREFIYRHINTLPSTTNKNINTTLSVNERVESIKDNITQEMNASVDRSIQVIRDKVESSAMNKSLWSEGFPIKFIIMDECDAMLHDAQGAMRRAMEKWMKNVRFILICNDRSKLLTAIVSRCTAYGFDQIDPSLMACALVRIGESEKIGCSYTTYETKLESMRVLAAYQRGDFRSALNAIQNMAAKSSFLKARKKKASEEKMADDIQEEEHIFSPGAVSEFLGIPPIQQCHTWLTHIQEAAINNTLGQDFLLTVKTSTSFVQTQGYTLEAWTNGILDYVLDHMETYPWRRSWICALHKAQIRSDSDCDIFIVLSGLVADLWIAVRSFKEVKKN
ncbi:MAG: replication factor C small subunit [Sylvanvirus sp.]|uniref:Replication factor C small subunit n=1 Tax=Sylvanvirus sp. TaxID=2487774 RepID=A0A3G5AGV4_9VIRU|nr:MAG: replication factor C small subunit [Sylvanvirus sp.]